MNKSVNGDPHDEEVKKPDFIYVSKEEFRQEFRQDPFSSSFQKPKKAQVSFKTRVLFLFLSFATLLFSTLIGLLTLLVTFVTLLFLFKNEELNQRQKVLYRLFKRSLIVLIGFSIGVFNPMFGLGIIMLYFSTYDVSKDKSFLESFVQTQYQNFM